MSERTTTLKEATCSTCGEAFFPVHGYEQADCAACRGRAETEGERADTERRKAREEDFLAELERVESVACSVCGEDYDRPVYGLFAQMRRRKEKAIYEGPPVCGPCADAADKARERQNVADWLAAAPERGALARGRWLPGWCEELGMTREDYPEFNRGLWEEVRDWTPSREKPFLGICGESGACKSRTTWWLQREHVARRAEAAECPEKWRTERDPDTVRRVIDLAAGSVAWTTGEELDELFAPEDFRASEGQKERRTKRIRKLESAPYLTIDDLDKLPTMERNLVQLSKLIKARLNERRATVWTANLHPAKWLAGATPSYGPPLVRRLADRDHATVIQV
jgi:hypothetical protein